MRFVYLLTCLVAQTVSLMASEIPVGSPTSDQLYVISRELYGRSLLNRLEYSALTTPSVDSTSGFNAQLLEQYQSLRQEFLSPSANPGIRANLGIVESNRQCLKNDNYIKLFPRIRIDFNQRFSANILYRVDGELTRDPRYEGKSWKGFAGFPENATLDFKAKYLDIRFGIERISWGFGRSGNFMFSRDAMPMTVIAASYHRSFFDFETVTAFLDPLKDQLDGMVDDTSVFTSQQRYLSAHSLSIFPVKGLSVSFRESILYGGPGRRLELGYLFPFVWYHGQQLNSRLDDNIFVSLASDYRLSKRLWLYGEFFIDDFQIDHKSRGGNEPNQLAYLVGSEFYDLLLPSTSIGLEYARINNWTYNQARAHNRYLNANFPIGFPDGPDQDVFNWTFTWWAKSNIRLSYDGSLRRQGEGRIDTPWTRPWLSVDNYSEPFPSGVVERRIVNGLGIMAFNKNRFWGNIRIKYTDINNVENIPARKESYWGLDLDIGIILPPISREF